MADLRPLWTLETLLQEGQKGRRASKEETSGSRCRPRPCFSRRARSAANHQTFCASALLVKSRLQQSAEISPRRSHAAQRSCRRENGFVGPIRSWNCGGSLNDSSRQARPGALDAGASSDERGRQARSPAAPATAHSDSRNLMSAAFSAAPSATKASFDFWPSPPCHRMASSMLRARPSCR